MKHQRMILHTLGSSPEKSRYRPFPARLRVPCTGCVMLTTLSVAAALVSTNAMARRWSLAVTMCIAIEDLTRQDVPNRLALAVEDLGHEEVSRPPELARGARSAARTRRWPTRGSEAGSRAGAFGPSCALSVRSEGLSRPERGGVTRRGVESPLRRQSGRTGDQVKSGALKGYCWRLLLTVGEWSLAA